MVAVAARHVFVSYVHEDNEQVDAMCRLLDAAQIPYWRDRTSLDPGDAWKAKIRSAIRDGSLVFLACFSEASRNRDRSHMNEELTIAVDEFRSMPPGRTWLIPVRFDDGDVPEWDLGAGRSLGDLNFVNLFGDEYTSHAVALITTIHRLMGERQVSTATAMAAIEQSTDSSRGEILRRLTKDALLDPSRRIELDDLITREVRRLVAAMNDPDRVIWDEAATNVQQVSALAVAGAGYWDIARPFCESLHVAARWGSADTIGPWVAGIRTLASNATKEAGGFAPLTDLRALVPLTAIMTASMTCVASARFENLKLLVVDPVVRDRYASSSVPILEALDPYMPFTHAGEIVPHVMTRFVIQGITPEEAFEYYADGRRGKYYTPLAEWMHHNLRQVFADQVADPGDFDDDFHRCEVMLGILSQDIASQRYGSDEGQRWRAQSRWFGRFTWNVSRGGANPIEEFSRALTSEGANWAPLRALLFGGVEERAKAAIEAYRQRFDEIRRNRF